MNDRPANFLPVVRRSIEDEIERLIGLLDGMDTDADLEGTGDAEPWLGWPNGCQIATPDMSCDDDRELEDASGFGDADGMAVDMQGEPDLGWTEEIDQERRLQTLPGWKVEDGEPDLGFIGSGTGWAGEAVYDDDREDVCEDEGADIQAHPHDAIDEGNDEPTLGRLETIHQGADSYMGKSEGEGRTLHFGGDGYSIGKKLLKRIGADGFVHTAPALPIAEYREIAETLPDGTVMRSIVSKLDGAPDLDGDWRALHYRAVHERPACLAPTPHREGK